MGLRCVLSGGVLPVHFLFLKKLGCMLASIFRIVIMHKPLSTSYINGKRVSLKMVV